MRREEGGGGRRRDEERGGGRRREEEGGGGGRREWCSFGFSLNAFVSHGRCITPNIQKSREKCRQHNTYKQRLKKGSFEHLRGYFIESQTVLVHHLVKVQGPDQGIHVLCNAHTMKVQLKASNGTPNGEDQIVISECPRHSFPMRGMVHRPSSQWTYSK